MSTSTALKPTLHLDLTLEDVSAVKIIKSLLKQLKCVQSMKVTQPKAPKTKMTEKEFYAKLDHSIATSSEDTMSVMQPSETGQQFLDRMLSSN